MSLLELPPVFAAPTTRRVGVVASDSFIRANSTTLGSTDQVLGGPKKGLAWTEVAGNWEINTNRIGSEGASPGGQGWLATVDIGVSDYSLEWMLAYAPDANSNSILAAYVDGTSFVRLVHTSSAIAFQRVTTGTANAIGTGSTGVTPAIGDIVRVSKIAAAYTARIIRAGIQVGTAATVASETQGQSSTVVGLRAATASVRYRNFVALRAA